MQRDIYTSLLLWKNKPSRKPLLLYGARQVGKTYILKEFGKNEYENFLYVNCDKNEDVANLFKQDYNIERILEGLSIRYKEPIISGATLIFFDEVQEIPQIVSSFKYFAENAPQFDVVAAGSLLGINDLKGNPFPVGKVDILHLYPMTFTEFLKGINEKEKAELLLRNDKISLINSLLPSYIELLRKYYFVGGMPEAVKIYSETGDTAEVRRIQKHIIDGYYADIAKHSGKEAIRCRQVLDSIPSQLARENKKFIFGAVKKGGRASDFEKAIQWLIDAGIVYKVPRISKVELPLKFYFDISVFKLYLLDVGLLGAMVEAPLEVILVGDKIFSEYKGAFTENYVLTQLVPAPDIVIGYFSKENSTVEVDFIVQEGSQLYPVEVKAEENVKSKSLRQFVTIDCQKNGFRGYRISMKGYEKQDWLTNIPLPAISLLFATEN